MATRAKGSKVVEMAEAAKDLDLEKPEGEETAVGEAKREKVKQPPMAVAPEKREAEIIHKVGLTVSQMVRVRTLLAWSPVETVGGDTMSNRLQSRFQFTPLEAQDIGYQEAEGRSFWNANTSEDRFFVRRVNERERQMLLNVIQRPPEQVPWRGIQLIEKWSLIRIFGGTVPVQDADPLAPTDEPEAKE